MSDIENPLKYQNMSDRDLLMVTINNLSNLSKQIKVLIQINDEARKECQKKREEKENTMASKINRLSMAVTTIIILLLVAGFLKPEHIRLMLMG